MLCEEQREIYDCAIEIMEEIDRSENFARSR